MSRLDKFKRKNKNNEGVNSAIADLMSGLMIVFLFIAVAFMSKVYDENVNIKKQQQTVENIVDTYEETKVNIYEDLYNEFKDFVSSASNISSSCSTFLVNIFSISSTMIFI